MWIGSSIQPMDQGIDARAGVKDVDRSQHVARLGEIDLDRIVHPPTGMDLHIRAVGTAGKEIASRTLADKLASGITKFVAMVSITPIQPSIGCQKAPMNTGGVSGKAKAIDQHLALVSDAVPIGIGEPPDIRRR